MLKNILLITITSILLFSCVSGKIIFMNETPQSKYAHIFTDKVIGVEPFEVEFTSSRFAIDLRGVKMSVNGQDMVLQKKYLMKTDIRDLGEVGILEINALKKTGADKELVKAEINKEWISGLLGYTNYKVGFFNKFGEGNSGFLTNVPLENTPKHQINFLPSERPTTYFKEVRDLTTNSKDGLDFILKGYLDISNEIVELIEIEEDSYNSGLMASMDSDGPQPGQYYLLCNAYIEWEIIDAITGEIIVDYNEKSVDLINTRNSTRVLLPIPNGDSEAFSRYFRNNDLTQYAIDEVITLMPRNFQFMAPYYKVTSKFIKDEE